MPVAFTGKILEFFTDQADTVIKQDATRMVGEKLKEIKEQMLSYHSMVQKPEQVATRTKFANWLTASKDMIYNKM